MMASNKQEASRGFESSAQPEETSTNDPSTASERAEESSDQYEHDVARTAEKGLSDGEETVKKPATSAKLHADNETNNPTSSATSYPPHPHYYPPPYHHYYHEFPPSAHAASHPHHPALPATHENATKQSQSQSHPQTQQPAHYPHPIYYPYYYPPPPAVAMEDSKGAYPAYPAYPHYYYPPLPPPPPDPSAPAGTTSHPHHPRYPYPYQIYHDQASTSSDHGVASATAPPLDSSLAAHPTNHIHQQQQQQPRGGGTAKREPQISTIVTVPANRYQLPSASASLAASHMAAQQSKMLPEGEMMEPYPANRFDDDADDDYIKFVRSLALQDGESILPEDDDEEEDFRITNLDDDDDDEEEEDDDDLGESSAKDEQDTAAGAGSKQPAGASAEAMMTPPSSPSKKRFTFELNEFDPQFYHELEDELGGLEEEDLEAAVASLLGTTSTSYAHAQKHVYPEDSSGENVSGSVPSEAKARVLVETGNLGAYDHDSMCEDPDTEKTRPPRGPQLPKATGMRAKAVVTPQQVDRLKALLNRHYQLLIQQAVLAIQAAHLAKTNRVRDKTDFLSIETGDDLIQVLDASIGMVQDLDQNRKDAIRNFIQFEDTEGHSALEQVERFDEQFSPTQEASPKEAAGSNLSRNPRRLTRAAFSRSLQGHATTRKSVFNIKGLNNLQDTFHALDRSIGSEIVLAQPSEGSESSFTFLCRRMLQQAGADFEETLLPGKRDLSEHLTSPQEYLGDEFEAPMTDEQEKFFRRFKSIFTSGEDNLVLRGVNLYGEKQWVLIADRFLPDRSINIISQRYSKLCVMLYKANGIWIDSSGDLRKPPRLESVEDIDDEKVARIKKPRAPHILNVHRWSLEEDLALMRAVPLMGHMWAEIGARLIPHRDRGHLRKRYQVLERRTKATIQRGLKDGDPVAKMAMKIRQNHRRDRMRQLQTKQHQGEQEDTTQHSQLQSSRQPVPPETRSQQPWPVPLLQQRHAEQHWFTSRQEQSTPPLLPSEQPQHQPPPANLQPSNTHIQRPSQNQVHQTRPKLSQSKNSPPPQLPSSQQRCPEVQPLNQQPLAQQQQKVRSLSDSKPNSKPPLPASRKAVAVNEDPSVLAAKKPAAVSHTTRKPRTVAVPGREDDVDDAGGGFLFNAESSREAFENLANETSAEWRQITRMNQMMENEVESEIVDTLANKLARESSLAAKGDAKQPLSSPNPSRVGTKRKAVCLPSTTRASRRLAAAAAVAKQVKETPTRKSPGLQQTRLTSKRQHETSGGTQGAETTSGDDHVPPFGSPDVNSTLFAGGNGTLDGLDFHDLESRRSAFGLEGNESNFSTRSRISANDLEAISALNSLSNSPAFPPHARASEGEGKNAKKQTESEEDKTLFSRIIGRRGSKRKLKF